MDKDRDLLIERLTHEAGSWKSIELKTNQDFVNSSGSQDPNMYQRAIYHEDYIETVLGQRFDRCLDVPAGGVEKLAEYYCDGVKCADVSFDAGAGSKQSQINIKKSFKPRERALRDPVAGCLEGEEDGVVLGYVV